MASAGYGIRDPVKVVIINTQYVETDSMSFKSVVQKLTGKDSKIEINPSSDFKDHQQQQQQQKARFQSVAGEAGYVPKSSDYPVMSRGLSFKDFDRFFKELPPIDELIRLC